MIILYQKIINILILRSIKQASWTIQFSQQASEHKRNSVADRIVMKRDISTEDVSKMQKCGQFLRGFKTPGELTALYIKHLKSRIFK